MSHRRVVVLATAVAVGIVPVVGAHTASAGPRPAPTPTPTPTKSVAPRPPAPKPPTPKPPAPKPPAPKPGRSNPVLRPGAKGAAVLSLQKTLTAQGYWLGTPNGYFGHGTSQAVMALQKVNGLSRDSIVGPGTWKALASGKKVAPRNTTGRVVEIDLTRQILVFAVNGKTQFVLNTSTGTSATPTPRGSYRIYRQLGDGWRTAPLGRLYRPKYFYQGYAIHGTLDGHIPGYPASHGCARLSTTAMDMLWTRAGIRVGDRVVVY